MIEYVYDADDATPIVVALTNRDGTPVDLTVASDPTLVGRIPGTDLSAELAGSVYGDPEDGQVRFVGIAGMLTPGTPGYIVVEYRVRWNEASAVRWSLEPFRRGVIVFP